MPHTAEPMEATTGMYMVLFDMTSTSILICPRVHYKRNPNIPIARHEPQTASSNLQTLRADTQTSRRSDDQVHPRAGELESARSICEALPCVLS